MSVSTRVRELVAAAAKRDLGSSARPVGPLQGYLHPTEPEQQVQPGFEQVEQWSVTPIRQNGFGLTARPD